MADHFVALSSTASAAKNLSYSFYVCIFHLVHGYAPDWACVILSFSLASFCNAHGIPHRRNSIGQWCIIFNGILFMAAYISFYYIE